MSHGHEDGRSAERNIHMIWLVADPVAFERKPGPTSPRDVKLTLGLTYREWRELFFVVLDVDQQQLVVSRETPSRIMEFDHEIPGYPMLTQINNVYGDAVFTADEVPLLERESTQLLSNVENPLALRGLQKLLAICREARKLNLSIFMMCD